MSYSISRRFLKEKRWGLNILQIALLLLNLPILRGYATVRILFSLLLGYKVSDCLFRKGQIVLLSVYAFGFFYHYSGLFKWKTVILSKVFWRIVNAMYSTLYINSLFRDYFEVLFSCYQVSWKLAWILLLWFTCTDISKILILSSPLPHSG